MSTDLTVDIAIDAPRDRVAAYALDYTNDPDWIGAIREARLVTDPPFGVGAQVERIGSFLGKRIEYVNEVVELDPDRRLVMRSVKAPFPMTVTYEFDDEPGRGTRMRIRTQGDASGFYRLAGPLLDLADPLRVYRGVGRDQERLAQVVVGDLTRALLVHRPRVVPVLGVELVRLGALPRSRALQRVIVG